MSLTNDNEMLREKRLNPDRPDSENVQEWWRDTIIFLSDYVRSQKIVSGTADSNPPSSTPSQLIDAAPDTGSLSDIVIGQTLEITSSDRAEQKRFVITDVDTGLDEIEVAEDLFVAGVRSGDSYRVIFSPPLTDNKAHCHDGIDSIFIPKPNFAIMYGMA